MRLPAVAAGLLLFCTPALAAPIVGPCQVFPDDNIWNVPIDGLPVDPLSDDYVASIGADLPLKPDFGAGAFDGVAVGIPITLATADQERHEIVFREENGEQPAPEESDPGEYAIPADAAIEGGTDRHVVVVQEQSCTLYELYKAEPLGDGTWSALGAARFDLETNTLRIEGWTSADAAGLPILPGLVRYDEVAAGEIRHALRFTAPETQAAYVWPARHFAAEADDPALPPMGQRFRLKADYDISGFSPGNQVILQALKTYGMMLADNGSPWFLSGTNDDNWNNDELQGELQQLRGSDFEAVDVSSLMVEVDSAQAASGDAPDPNDAPPNTDIGGASGSRQPR